ncbi:MAG: biopolymer transporter Tol, partial [Desulfobacteraceae bacterium]
MQFNNLEEIIDFAIDKEKEERITFGLRANNPSVSNDGKKITFVFQNDGTVNLGLCDINGKNFKRITFFEKGEQLYNPKFSNDDSFILFDYSYHDNRDIGRVDTSGSNY